MPRERGNIIPVVQILDQVHKATSIVFEPEDGRLFLTNDSPTISRSMGKKQSAVGLSQYRNAGVGFF
jgi:hypothetical protein